MKYDFLLSGVGGQGTILTGDILAEVGLRAGMDSKKAEVHGMAQRGGQVESHVRWGNVVYSPLIEKGKADYLLGFEMLEAVRWVEFMKPGGIALVNDYRIDPLAVTSGQELYPSKAEIAGLFEAFDVKLYWIDAIGIAKSLGNAALVGSVLLGVVSTVLPVAEQIWLAVIREMVPRKHVEANEKAFLAGRQISIR